MYILYNHEFTISNAHTVLFIGGIVAATVEIIELSTPVHSFGAVSRWLIMYPYHTDQSDTI